MPEVFTDSAEETIALGRKLGERAQPGWVVGLSGDLGAGKTTFTRGFLAGAGGNPDDVTSPTFTLMHEYRARIPVYHLDLYRLETAQAARDAGVEEFLGGDGVALVEWYENARELLPEDFIEIRIEIVAETRRRVVIKGIEWR